ncbi:MAG TPA: glycosyltransferase [Solirubrobacteraceae bacterium]|nr:glycosyltransferase [Solirubrobacteraceae bacterium]
MRIALVSPYSWSYPGGVTRHIQALAEQFLADGHEVRVLAPLDPDDAIAALAHRGARPQRLRPPDYLRSLGRTVGLKANGSVSNLMLSGRGAAVLARELRRGGYDVVHVHEPVAPLAGWVAALCSRSALVGTFHSYSVNPVSNGLGVAFGARLVLNRLHVRIAVSEAAAWTGRRFFGGRYRVIPNGVAVGEVPPAPKAPADRLRLVFVGQAVERKGLPLLLRAFEALREHVPAELTVIGPDAAELEPMMLDGRGVRVLGKVDDRRKRLELEAADLLCAPSLRGESFGMVLTEAFAAGTPVVASDIAGYRDVVRDGVDGVLVCPGDAQALAETLRDLWEEPERRARMAQAAVERARRFSWPTVAAQVMDAYRDAIAVPAPQGARHRAAVRLGLRSAGLEPHAPAQRLPSLEPTLRERARPAVRAARRVAAATVSVAAIALAVKAMLAIGIASIAAALVASSPSFVLLGLGVMCSAMALRAVSWHAILRAALPGVRVRLADALRGTFIGVLMSSTLPARLGEPSRALVVARRTGRPREHLPIVLGTIVSQTLLNIVALIVLGSVMVSSIGLFSGHQDALLAVAVAPALLLALILLAPLMLRERGLARRFRRLQALVSQARRAMARVRTGLIVFRRPRLGAIAAAAQLGAWGLQMLSCYVLLVALGLSHRAGLAAAAAVLFAVNITAVLPATPANLGVFQAACATVLHAGWHVGFGTGVAYGVILQAVEVATAILMGAPALLKEGMSWREVRLRALHASPVSLPARPRRPARSPAGALENG